MPGLIPDAYAGRLAAFGWVIQQPDAVPRLAFGVSETRPPRGGDLALTGWTWDGVPHHEQAGVRWGEFVVVGRLEGGVLHVSEPPSTSPAVDSPVMRIGRLHHDRDAALMVRPMQFDLRAVQAALRAIDAMRPPGFFGSSVEGGRVLLWLLAGSVSAQRQIDRECGAGLVEIRSLLVPID